MCIAADHMNENNYTIYLQYTTGVSNISGSHRMANLLIECQMGMSTLSSSFSSLELQAIYSVDQQLCSAWH